MRPTNKNALRHCVILKDLTLTYSSSVLCSSWVFVNQLNTHTHTHTHNAYIRYFYELELEYYKKESILNHGLQKFEKIFSRDRYSKSKNLLKCSFFFLSYLI